MNESFCCFTSLLGFGVVRILDWGHFNRCIMLSRCFNLNFPDNIWCGTSFHILISHQYIFFGELPIKIVDPFFKNKFLVLFSSVQSCPTLCDPMDWSTLGFPIHHQLPEPAQTHVHKISHAIQPSHSLSFPSPPTFSLSQHQGLFQWVSSLCQVAKVLEF